ncbi:LysR family transcriptional regulator [Rhodoferax sp. TS-BS-61-7]|uniref:LysR family transcriptional regulator n=1 Tax=Rhodoferax sp. TS-BS-61-7 TaxID=2094194 RepID=UPI000CF7233A|nr:LysR family transcriptional regulator [Rhodoferax sp. TS-BS-61-7]PQA75726.1 LysR family transcriptional regulator [Rhodoferax sp. TS-BS-61-7]
MNNQPLLEDMRLFCAVVRTQSFAAVARDLGLSNAVISKRINLLERALQAKLLHRTTRRLTVTEQGDTVYQRATRILEDVDAMAQAITTHREAPRGLLRLCSSSGFGSRQLAPALAALAKRYPTLELQLELLDRPVDLVGEGFQLDIRVGQVQEPHLITRRIAHNQRVLCAAPSYVAQHGAPQSLQALAQHQCLVIRERDQDVGRWTLDGPQGPETVKVTGALSANNGEVVHRWAIEGLGILLRSTWDVGPSIAQGTLERQLPDYAQEAPVWAVYPTRLAHSAKVRVCVEFLEAWFRDTDLGATVRLPKPTR